MPETLPVVPRLFWAGAIRCGKIFFDHGQHSPPLWYDQLCVAHPFCPARWMLRRRPNHQSALGWRISIRRFVPGSMVGGEESILVVCWCFTILGNISQIGAILFKKAKHQQLTNISGDHCLSNVSNIYIYIDSIYLSVFNETSHGHGENIPQCYLTGCKCIIFFKTCTFKTCLFNI